MARVVVSFAKSEEELYQRILEDLGPHGKISSWFKDAAELKLKSAQEPAPEKKEENKPLIDPIGLLRGL